MSETFQLPVIPMRDAVLFPGVIAPVSAGRPGTVAAIEQALSHSGRRVFVVTQREDRDDVQAEGLYTIGTVAHIAQVQRGPNGMQLVLHGDHRGIAVRVEDADGHLVATVRETHDIPPSDPDGPAFVALHREVRRVSAELGEKAGLPKQAVSQFLSEVNEPGRLADLVAAYVEIATADRQTLLETLSVDERLALVLRSHHPAARRPRRAVGAEVEGRRRSSATARRRCSCASSSRRSRRSSATPARATVSPSCRRSWPRSTCRRRRARRSTASSGGWSAWARRRWRRR